MIKFEHHDRGCTKCKAWTWSWGRADWLISINFFMYEQPMNRDIYVLDVEEFTADISTELPCLGDLENPGQLPVQRYFEVLVIMSYRFSQFLHYLCLWGGSRTISPRTISPRTISPRTTSPWTTSPRTTSPRTISPRTISPLDNIPLDNIPPRQYP